MKKTLSLILGLSLAVSSLPITAAHAETNGDMYFTDGPRTVEYTAVEPNQGYNYNNYTEESRNAYKFTVGNENFSLLDVNASDNNSKYFVMSNTVYGKHQMKGTAANYFQHAVDGSGNVFEGTATSWLKDEFANSYPTFWLNSGHFYAGYGLENKQPDVPRIANDIRAYLDTNHVWTCEPAPNAATPNDTYTFKAGLAFPSAREFLAYQDRITFIDSGAFALRTMINYDYDGSKRYVGNALLEDGGLGKIAHWDAGTWQNVRPCFWLKDGFFANVKVDLATAGDAVKQEIKKVGYVGLLSIYTRDEVENQLGLYPDGGILATVSTRSSNVPAYGETLIADYEYLANDGFSPVSSNITWKKTEGETTTVLGSGSTYVVKEPDAAVDGTRIFFDITLTGADGSTRTTTSTAAVIPGLGVEPVGPNTSVAIKTAADAADTFMVGDNEFTLLDSFDNDESTFFVAANDNYGTMTMKVPWMDTTDMSNYGYWFDNEFKNMGNEKDTGGVVKKLPDGIVSYINNNHEWLTEGAPENASAYYGDYPALENDYYTYTAGVAPLSVHEIRRYSDVLGSTDNIGGGYFTRTAVNWRNKSGDDMVPFILHATPRQDSLGNDIIFFAHYDLASASKIRPAFYLTKDFFKNVQLDWDMIGSNVKAAMAKMYYVEDLEHLYDSFNLEDAGFKHKPQSEMNVTFSSYGNPTDVLNALSGATSLQANVTYKSLDDKVNAKLVLAVYDEAGNLIKIAINDLKSDTNTAEGSVGIAALEGITASHEAKLMIWDNLSNCKPVEKAVLFNSESVLTPATAVTRLSSRNRGNNFFGVSRFA